MKFFPSIFRCYAILYPIKAKLVCTVSKAYKVVGMVWTLSFLLAIPMLFIQVGKYRYWRSPKTSEGHLKPVKVSVRYWRWHDVTEGHLESLRHWRSSIYRFIWKSVWFRRRFGAFATSTIPSGGEVTRSIRWSSSSSSQVQSHQRLYKFYQIFAGKKSSRVCTKTFSARLSHVRSLRCHYEENSQVWE